MIFQQHIQEVLNYLNNNVDADITGIYISLNDRSFVFVGYGEEESIVLEFSPGGRLTSHRKSDGHGVADNAIEDLECASGFEWMGLE